MKNRRAILLLWLFIVAGSFLAGCVRVKPSSGEKPDPAPDVISENQTGKKPAIEETSEPETEAPFEIRMLDVGQGLSILIKADGHYLIYDGGGRDYSSYVVRYLKQRNIDTLDYMIASHYDEDHINGLIGILNTTKVSNVLTPDYIGTSKTYQSFRDMLDQNGARENHPKTGETYSLGDAVIDILGPVTYDYENENDRSIVVKVTYGNFRCVITGDAEYGAEQDMVSSEREMLDTDLYIVGHHGSSSSSSPAMVEAMSPAYAMISVGEDNPYGHPSEETLERLSVQGCEIFRTDQQGEVSAFSDGRKVWFSTKTSKSSTTAVSSESDAATKTYILNTNTMKFHLPGCESILQMNEKNKEEYTGSRDELMEEGYEPCGNCNP